MKLTRPFVIIALALSIACGASLRHLATIGSTAVYDALTGVQAVADGEVQTGLMSQAQRAQLATHLLPALKTGHALNTVIANWTPGQPVPAELKILATNLGLLVQDVVADFTSDPVAQAKAQAYVGTAQAALLSILAGIS